VWLDQQGTLITDFREKKHWNRKKVLELVFMLHTETKIPKTAKILWAILTNISVNLLIAKK